MIPLDVNKHRILTDDAARNLISSLPYRQPSGGVRLVVYRHAAENRFVLAELINGDSLRELHLFYSWPASTADWEEICRKLQPSGLEARRIAADLDRAKRQRRDKAALIGARHRHIMRKGAQRGCDHPLFHPPRMPGD